MNVIGRFFAEEWQRALKNEGEFYTPIPSVDMSLDQLNAIRYQLEQMVEYWTVQMDPTVNTAWEARANAEAIVDLESQKLAAVNSIIQLKTMSTSTGDSSGETVFNPTDPIYQGSETSGGGSTWLLIIGLGVGAWLLFGKSKGRRNQVAARKKTKR
jgi:hypothetical protein